LVYILPINTFMPLGATNFCTSSVGAVEGDKDMGTLEYDEEASRRLLAVYTTPDVAAQREAFARALSPRAGERILDIGSGPGFLVSILAEAVGPAGSITGVDISEPMNEAARAHCNHQGWVEIVHGHATKLPLASATVDAAISTQVLEYVADIDAAIAEIYRVVRSGG
jgi:ubiquinone/menaquinone biosynthesis C-methylase UbiE